MWLCFILTGHCNGQLTDNSSNWIIDHIIPILKLLKVRSVSINVVTMVQRLCCTESVWWTRKKEGSVKRLIHSKWMSNHCFYGMRMCRFWIRIIRKKNNMQGESSVLHLLETTNWKFLQCSIKISWCIMPLLQNLIDNLFR